MNPESQTQKRPGQKYDISKLGELLLEKNNSPKTALKPILGMAGHKVCEPHIYLFKPRVGHFAPWNPLLRMRERAGRGCAEPEKVHQ